MQDLTLFATNHMALTYSLSLVLILLLAIEYLRSKRNHFRIDVQKAIELINRENAAVIDIRTNELYRKGHIIDAVSLPETDTVQPAKKMEKFKKRPIILVCSTGTASQKIAALLLKQGYNTYLLAGGIRAWQEAQMPLVKE